MKFAVQLVAIKVEKGGSKTVHRVLGQYVNHLGTAGGDAWNKQRGVKVCFQESILAVTGQSNLVNPILFERRRKEAEKKKQKPPGRGVSALVSEEEYFPLRKYRMVTTAQRGRVGGRQKETRMSMAIGHASEDRSRLVSGGSSSVQVEESETELCVCCAVVPQPCTIDELRNFMISTAGKSKYLGGKMDDKVREACWDLYTVALYMYERGALPNEGSASKLASEKKAKAAADDDSDSDDEDDDEGGEIEMTEVKNFEDFEERSALDCASWVPQGINTKPFKICREVDGREELAGSQFLFEAHHDGRSYTPAAGPDYEKKLHRRKDLPIDEKNGKMYEKKMGKAELKDIFATWQVWRRYMRMHVLGAGSGKLMRRENDDVVLQYVNAGSDDDDSDGEITDLREKHVEYTWEKADATKCRITPIVWRRQDQQNSRRLAEDWAQDLMVRVCAAQQDGQTNFKSASLKKLVLRLQDKVDWCQKITTSTVKDKAVKNKAGRIDDCLNALDTIKRKTYIDKEQEFQDRKDGYKLDNKNKRQFFADEGLELPPAELHEKTLEGLKSKVSKASKELKKMQERLELAQAQNQKELIETNDLVEGVAKAKRDVEAEKKAAEACKTKKSAAEGKAMSQFQGKVEQRKKDLMEMAGHILAGAIVDQRRLTETKKKAKKGKEMEKIKKKNSAKKNSAKKKSSGSRK
jgi:hypothetical protein